MIVKLRALATSATVRWGLALAYLLGGGLFAFGLPDTPDEITRIEDVGKLLGGVPYNFFWPVGNMAAIAVNPLFHFGWLEPVQAVRLFNLLLSAPPILWLMLRCREPLAIAAAAVALPYLWLVTATASQQGLMVPLLILILWAAVNGRIGALALSAAGLYLVNPAMLPLVPGGFLLASMAGARLLPAAGAALLGVVPFFGVVLLAWAVTGEFRPTLSGNGAFNLWLGNNPDPLSHRGVAPRPMPGDPLGAMLGFLREETGAFVENLLRKAALYWAPWDYLRSGMGGRVQTAFFVYVAIAQATIYGTAIALRRSARPGALAAALGIALMAWALYTVFFVKVRFRIPFDLLILAAVMLPLTAPGRAGTRRDVDRGQSASAT